MNKYEQCNDCIYADGIFDHDCENCINGNHQVTNADLMEDFEINSEVPPYEEDKSKYFLIRWLIKYILKVESENCSIWFAGLSKCPCGEKQKIDGDYSLLFRIFFPFVHVWQYCDGGYTGDDFQGNLYFRLFPFVWLVFSYQC